ncbi:glycosyltransferase involved in cell wall biosynthesis [Sphingobium sp. B11D3B]|uniref:glycosyltransferase family 4 protein n=1 Tax=unclassified Sphingobium TaxID=2611147 RepID=UPI0022253A3B|nr:MULTISPECIES: glycosyltransferase family 4 protein [unclassified Sphingobium]MCW2365735.1 glycosyltransferase involved in cell wall biosynthesis [Sphingobium sp. B7D2B]MCW2388668.1 glycosyltransferase involved in cell wall biosynthesis [Sphingobium sp. B11D3B]
MIKVLLITEDLPASNYGTGQRIRLWKEAIETIGECRVLHMALPGSAPSVADYSAPMAFDYRAYRMKWLWWQGSFGYYRAARRYHDLLHGIHREFPFDAAICSFFKTAPFAPLDLAPCILDVDALLWPDSSFARAIWPLTQMAMRRRARRFAETVVIAKHEGDVLASPGLQPKLLPGASRTVQAALDPEQPRGRNILFVGPRHWQPNREAMEALISSGLPARLDDAGYTLRLVGQGTDEFPPMRGLSGGGFVDDIAQEYAQAALVLSSTEAGNGANIKLAEAIQYGCAVIASDYSARGYEGVLVPGEHLMTYADPAALPDLVMATLADEPLLRRIVQMRPSWPASG